MPRSSALLLLLAATGCFAGEATLLGVVDSDGGRVSCAETLGSTPLRRLTNVEYDNTVADLLGDNSRPATEFPTDGRSSGFRNNVAVQAVSELHAEGYWLASEKLAGAARDRLSTLLPCDPLQVGEEACAIQFISRFGLRAFRAPVDPEHAARLLHVYRQARAQFDFATGIELTMQAMLQSPHFLYRVELGQTGVSSGSSIPLTSYEVATRLSYFLWGTMPDEALLDAAAAQALTKKEQVGVQVDRMLASPKARSGLVEFHSQWLKLDQLAEVQKDLTRYPDVDAELKAQLRRETELFVEDALFNKAGDLKTLLTSPTTFMTGTLARHYGTGTVSGDSWTPVEQNPAQRAGVLTQGSVLTLHARSNASSPVRRGLFVRRALFCTEPPPPPPGTPAAPDPAPDATVREQFAVHTQSPACAGCHLLMDPIGFGFEHYDAVGRFRDTESGKRVDASAELVATDVDGPYDGVPQLAQRLARSGEVLSCMVTQWFRYANGRAEEVADACSIGKLTHQFQSSGGNIRGLVRSIAVSDSFLLRAPFR